ncbi:hypothetical protein BJ912DRAFT_962796 [Pholiota molesta]|nr:hypothetical protein BJ912DRAFT_962796 [Pholiota molesta]
MMTCGFGDNGHESGPEVTPSSVTLQTALLSGSVLISLWFVLEGLRLSDRDQSGRHELLAIASCLQLVTAGAPMVKQMGPDMGVSLDDIVQALEKLREDKVIQHPNGVRLLETTITLAKNKFAETISPAESWTFFARPSSNTGTLRNYKYLIHKPKRHWSLALPGTQRLPYPLHQFTTHILTQLRPTSDRHVPTTIIFRAGGAGIQGRGFVRALRFIL